MPDYIKARATAQRMINNPATSRELAMVRYATTVVDPDDPLGAVTLPYAPVTVRGVYVEPSSNTALGFSIQNHAMFKACSAIFLLAADGVNDFEEFDEVIDRGKKLIIDHVEKLDPGETPILYFVGVKTP